ncbi:MAG TPA: response regulator transcription factor [Opitutaceae bacterium]
MVKRIRVLIVEDHPMVRTGMRSLIDGTEDLVVCGETGNMQLALEIYRREQPDVVCLDLMLGATDGIDLILELRRADPAAKILVLSVKDEDTYAERCMRSGALGYAMKTESNEALLEGLRRVASGEVHVSMRIAMTLLTRVQRPVRTGRGMATLTDRELQVFQLVGLGMSTRQIAERLGIGVKTVETHREHIKNKLGLDHTAALVRVAVMWVKQTLDSDASG